MAKRGEQDTKKEKGGQTVYFKSRPAIIGSYSIAGEKEGKGPVGKYINNVVNDCLFGEKTHEMSEQKMFEHAISGAIKDAGLKPNQIDMMLSGDLLNQIISSSFAARSFDLMFVGIYGACSTMALSLAMGSVMVDGGFVNNAVVSAGSHFATAERQYRYPLELGNQRPPVSQWTVTGAGSIVLSNKSTAKSPCVTAATFGKVIDWGVLDVNNMGAAMAPAAAATIIAHFRDTGRKPSDYSHIFTGDLGKLGEDILRDLLAEADYTLGTNYSDCGRLIYDEAQNLYQGGSGCGCSAVVLNSFIMKKLRNGEYKRILFVATGALLSPVSSFQGNTVPGIAHAVVIEC
ncbi:MAG: stage V sporulation protein AD [Christensenellaceae bacterium]|nr:stage V sporulation protein AD [Christensenellaceae bacterium]